MSVFKNIFQYGLLVALLWWVVTKGLGISSIWGSIGWYFRSGGKVDSLFPLFIMGFIALIGIYTTLTLTDNLWMLAMGRRVPLIYLGNSETDLAHVWAPDEGMGGKEYTVVLEGFNTLESVGKTMAFLKDPASGNLMDRRDLRIDLWVRNLGMWALTFPLTMLFLALFFGLPKLNPDPRPHQTIEFNSGSALIGDFFSDRLGLTPAKGIVCFGIIAFFIFGATRITDFLHVTRNEHRRIVHQKAGNQRILYQDIMTQYMYVPELEKRVDFIKAPQAWASTKSLAEGTHIQATLITLRDWRSPNYGPRAKYRLAIFRFEGLFPQPVYASELMLRGEAEDHKLSVFSRNSIVLIELGPGGAVHAA